MSLLKIRIQSLADVANGIPLVDGLTKENTIETNDVSFCILEGGMQSGATSVIFVLKLPDGTFAVGEASAKNMVLAAAALKGAMERFGDS